MPTSTLPGRAICQWGLQVSPSVNNSHQQDDDYADGGEIGMLVVKILRGMEMALLPPFLSALKEASTRRRACC